jgi:hypothetical protein
MKWTQARRGSKDNGNVSLRIKAADNSDPEDGRFF